MIFSPDVAAGLHRLIAVMARYCDDLAPCDEVEASRRGDLHPWERAAVDMGTALHLAAECLSRGAGKPASGEVTVLEPGRAQHLAAAATALAAGRDLLQTHFDARPGGLVQGRSEWATAITSASVTRALAGEIARWSATLAPFTSRLAAPAAAMAALPRGPGMTAGEETYGEFASASQWLRTVGPAVRAALDADPVRPADKLDMVGQRGGTILAVWPGKWSSDVFEVDDRSLARRVLQQAKHASLADLEYAEHHEGKAPG
jgi:hypothetical protein